jgi:predicted HAD superfamily hydrolase
VKCTDDVSDENQQLNPNHSLTKIQDLETNTAKQLYYELDKNFTKQDEETENNCSVYLFHSDLNHYL